ncbi:hypothetical protein JCM19298_189 [Nonlabens ulvanivorans]|nr:hypothetical protein JCM19297_214 [Nonlabens ulvanivorans]GAK94616.1 hypothetical protein JCM19298_189 [Nonlabens ulvanivorans]
MSYDFFSCGKSKRTIQQCLNIKINESLSVCNLYGAARYSKVKSLN